MIKLGEILYIQVSAILQQLDITNSFQPDFAGENIIFNRGTMEAHNGKQKRKHPRTEANFVVSYRILEGLNNYDLSQSKNISQGGMLLTTNREFKKGTRLVMTMSFPFIEDKMELTGQVVGSKEIVKDLIYETRLQFYELDLKLSKGLSKFVNQKS